jgi:excisionase family DNA binding protein
METIANQMKNKISIQELSFKVFLTLEEAATFTGISKSYLYKLTHRGSIPFSKPQGKLIFFERLELENWLRQNSSKPVDAERIEGLTSAHILKGQKGGSSHE